MLEKVRESNNASLGVKTLSPKMEVQTSVVLDELEISRDVKDIGINFDLVNRDENIEEKFSTLNND